MAFIQANIYSNVLEMEVNLNVILPQTTKRRLAPVQSKRQRIYLFYIYFMEWVAIIVYGKDVRRLNVM